MSFKEKVKENKMIADKCLELIAYNAGVTRAYYSAFQHIKNYLISSNFNYKDFLKEWGVKDRSFSHGTIHKAVVTCMESKGKNKSDLLKLGVIEDLYQRRKKADYREEKIIGSELKTSIDELNIILSIVS